MKTLLVFAAALAIAAPALAKAPVAQTWTGILIDKSCATNIVKKYKGDVADAKARAHTKKCATMDDCAPEGYGLYSDHRFIPFDKAGNTQAASLLSGTQKKDDLEVSVTGVMKGRMIAVTKLTEK